MEKETKIILCLYLFLFLLIAFGVREIYRGKQEEKELKNDWIKAETLCKQKGYDTVIMADASSTACGYFIPNQ